MSNNLKPLVGVFSLASQMKWILITVLVCSFSFCAFIYFDAQNRVQAAIQNPWLVDNKTGDVYKGLQTTGAFSPAQREVEYRNHVNMFYNLFYAYDQFTYEKNLEKALNLIGESGKAMFLEDQHDGMLRRLQEQNNTVTIVVDSIKFDMNSNPVRGWAWAKQTNTRVTGSASRHLDSEFIIYDLPSGRTDLNPHAAMIDRFIITNKTKVE